MEIILANLAGKTRKETLNGRFYLVVPMTLMPPNAVMVGNKGGILYPADEQEKSVPDWDYKPIVDGHPVLNGEFVSVYAAPGFLESSTVGFARNTSYPGKLRSEAWFDEQQTANRMPDIWNKIKKGEAVTLSTGLGADNEEAIANSRDRLGASYGAIARNFRPDHIAVLRIKGACDIAQGCGFNVHSAGSLVEEKVSTGAINKVWQAMGEALGFAGHPVGVLPKVVNQLSHDQLHSSLSVQLRERFPGKMNEYGYINYDCYILAVYDKYIVYEKSDTTYRLDYKTDLRDNSVTLSDEEPVEVRRVVSYKPVSNTYSGESPLETSEEAYMAVKLNDQQRKDIVNGLVANCNCPGNMPWKGKTPEQLNALSDEVLLVYQDTRQALVSNAGGDIRDGFMDQLGNRHTFNKTTQAWETTPAATPVAQPVTNAQAFTPTNTPPFPGAVHVPGVGWVMPLTPQIMNQQPQIHPSSAGYPLPQNPVATAAPAAKPQTAADWFKNAPPEVQGLVQKAAQINATQKQGLVERLTANLSGDAKVAAEQIYGGMDVSHLEVLVANTVQAQTPAAPQNEMPTLNFLGAGGAPAPTNYAPPTEEEPLVAPKHSWGK